MLGRLARDFHALLEALEAKSRNGSLRRIACRASVTLAVVEITVNGAAVAVNIKYVLRHRNGSVEMACLGEAARRRNEISMSWHAIKNSVL